jgi:magnesium-transporting ATPase (P-type)
VDDDRPVGNLFVQRTEYASVLRISPSSNPLVWVGIATELILLVLLLYTPFLQHIFGTAPFPLGNWLFLCAWTPALLLADACRKALVRRRMVQHQSVAHDLTHTET